MRLLPAAFAVGASAAALEKRCSPIPNPEYYGGYSRPPCWFGINSACWPVLYSGTQLTVDVPGRTAVISPVSAFCVGLIAEEHARELDGRKVYGWTASEGTLDTSQQGVLVITNMSNSALNRYSSLVPPS